MTLDDVLHDLIHCLGSNGNTQLAWEQVQHWPKGAIEVFLKAGWLKETNPATKAECPGCEEICSMLVHIIPAHQGQPVRAFIACDQRSDMGRVKIPLQRLQQWQFSLEQVALWCTKALGLKGRPERNSESGSFRLGHLRGAERIELLELAIAASANASNLSLIGIKETIELVHSPTGISSLHCYSLNSLVANHFVIS